MIPEFNASTEVEQGNKIRRKLIRLVKTIMCVDCANVGTDTCGNSCDILVSAVENYRSAFKHMINWHREHLKTCQPTGRSTHEESLAHLTNLIEEPPKILIHRSKAMRQDCLGKRGQILYHKPERK
jgi:hypothetical protein